MPNYQTPGVYVEEIESGSKPIEAGSTNIVGFLGVAEKGPVNQATLVTNWTQYTKIFGDFMRAAGLVMVSISFFRMAALNAISTIWQNRSKKRVRLARRMETRLLKRRTSQ